MLASVHEEKVDSTKGVKIFVRSWVLESTPRAVAVICHGVNSHSGQYLWVGEQLVADGLAVYALDLRGRGRSDGERFYVETVDDYVSDVATVEDFSRDPNAVEALNNDPLTANEAQPAITVAALVRADERLREEFPLIMLPVLIMHGTDDKATVCHGSQFFHETAGSRDKTLKLYEGHYHDLLNDIGKQGVMADIKAWIESRLT